MGERATLLVALSHIYATHVVGRDSRLETANVCACRELAVAASFFLLSSTAEPPPPLQLYGPIGEAFEREHARASWKNNAGPTIPESARQTKRCSRFTVSPRACLRRSRRRTTSRPQ